MATRAPSRARRRAMPRPMRLAAPVTRMVCLERLDCRFAMDLDLLWFYTFAGGLGETTGHVGPGPEDRGARAEGACYCANGAGVVMLRGDSGQGHGNHHDTPWGRFDGGEDAAAVVVGDVAQQLAHVERGAHPDGHARQADEEQGPGEIAHLAKDDVGAAMHHVADHDGALVICETDAAADLVGQRAARQQSQAGAAPDGADARRTLVEYQFAEHAEQDLRV